MSASIAIASRQSTEIPDPYKAACLHRRAVPAEAGKRWWAQHERRSQIFAISRQLLGDQGPEKLSMRFVAESCNVSLQTIYNLAGDRGAVMREAIVEHIDWTAANAAFPDATDPSALLNFLHMLAGSAVSYPQYNANAARYATGQREATFTCHAALVMQFARFLGNLRAQGKLRGAVLINPLAGQMAELTNSTICREAMHPYDADQFYRDVAYGSGMMLLACLPSSDATRFETALHAIMTNKPLMGATH